MAITDTMKRPAAVFALRTLFGAVIVYLFLVVLIIANAQQHVVGSLADGVDGENLSYGQAMFRYRAAEALRRNLQEASDQWKKADAAADAERAQFVTQDNLYEPRWQEVQDLANRLSASDCAFDADSNTRPIELYRIVSDCSSPTLKPQLNTQIDQMQARVPAFPTLVETWRLQKQNVDAKQALVDQLSKRMASINTQLADPKVNDVEQAFAETRALDGSWYLLNANIESFLPFVVQLWLALTSGMFGALLVALIIMVYPNNSEGFTRTEGFFARVVVGGLISICVYLVLGSGSAVLGSGGTMDVSSTNVMAFCAIGVLAGMFSDRVAFWLSQRAGSFFGKGGGADGLADQAGGQGDDTAPAAPAS
ncbi:hypothetical protein QO010_002253 [Caulobacter ginsengisoli]|uniref:Uncharacterized protein n=1 Tax=Caulobacter ginsengisoli TaxID=400775 RepID=A0ABU0IR34_9CAUL|nr:hypothetical protein [Caulobacter ginsengisoli]MDQ0464472.1 hypothetical protein [Caulobacter ginsengisoli]